jgi:AraC-like DNA-binding protein
MAETEFGLMTAHGDGMRLRNRGGRVILSRLSGGSSFIQAVPPSLKFVLEGEETYEVAGRTRRLRAGDFMLVEGGQELKVRTPRSVTTTGMCLYLDAAPAGMAEAEWGASVAGSASDPLAAMVNRYARILARQPDAGEKIAQHIHCNVSAAIDCYLSSLRSKVQLISSLKYSTRLETLQRVERARSFIHDQAKRHLTLEEIASEAALSRFHLTRSFTEVFGVPPLAYHRSLRLEHAAERLRRGEVSATQISVELGYSSLSAFTRAFRNMFGVPPSQAQAA